MPHKLRRRLFRERQVLVPMGNPGLVRRRLALTFELPYRVLPDSLQQPIADWSCAGVVEQYEVLVDQSTEKPDDLVREHILTRGDSLGSGQAETSGEHRKTGEHLAFGDVQQLPGPVDHGE